jgi:hypothetical protein
MLARRIYWANKVPHKIHFFLHLATLVIRYKLKLSKKA